MRRLGLFASGLMACLLIAGLDGSRQPADGASAKRSATKHGYSANIYAKRFKRRGIGPRVYLPIGPSYLAYDYPYYYSRGYYPKHIGPGYIYGGVLYRDFGRSYRPR